MGVLPNRASQVVHSTPAAGSWTPFSSLPFQGSPIARERLGTTFKLTLDESAWAVPGPGAEAPGLARPSPAATMAAHKATIDAGLGIRSATIIA